jgi:hypothetical protein
MHLDAASSDVKEFYLLKVRVALNVRVKNSMAKHPLGAGLKERSSPWWSQRPSVALHFAISASLLNRSPEHRHTPGSRIGACGRSGALNGLAL